MLFLMFCICFKNCFIRYCFHRCGFVFKRCVATLCDVSLSCNPMIEFLKFCPFPSSLYDAHIFWCDMCAKGTEHLEVD